MKIIIDTDVIQEYMSLGAFCYTLSLFFKDPITTEVTSELFQKYLVDCDFALNQGMPNNPTISEIGKGTIQTIILDSEYCVNNDPKKDRFVVLADKMRELFPSGKKEGTQQYWRESTATIAKRMKGFVKKFGDFSDEQILKATKNYVESFNGYYKYMQILRYFIFKQVIEEGEAEGRSQLLNYIENEGQEEQLTSNWTSELN